MSEQSDRDEILVRLYDTYHKQLYRYLISLGISEHLDDIIQEAFLRLNARLHKPDNPIEHEKLSAYLFTTARNLAFDQHRRLQRANQVEVQGNDDFLQSIPDVALSPEKIYEEKELASALKKAIEKLPKKIAEAVKGLLDGKTLETTASELGIQVPALKYRLRKARDLLNRKET